MAYDEALAERVRTALTGQEDVVEQKMFGGLCFMVNGRMCCGITGDRLMLKLGEDGASESLTRPHTAPMDFTGRVLKSMVFVEPSGTRSEPALRRWVDMATEFALSLPRKSPRKSSRKGKTPVPKATRKRTRGKKSSG